MKGHLVAFATAALVGLAVAAGCSSSSSSGSPGSGDKCSAFNGAMCGSLTIQFCYTPDANGACTGSPYYQTSDGKKYSCNSCTDVTGCATAVANACSGGGDAGGGG